MTTPPPEAANRPIWRAPDLAHGIVAGRHWVHNPWGRDALALLSRRGFALVGAADGRPAREVALQVAAGDPTAAAALLADELPLLVRNGFVRQEGTVPLGPAPPERVFNLWLHVTNACNLACPYCYIHKDKTPMPAAVFERALQALEATAQSGAVDRLHVRLAGGEPMLRFAELQRFVAEAHTRCGRHGIRFSAAVLTNGTVVPAGAVAWARDHGVSVSVSIDGVGPMQDAMRPTQAGGASWQALQRGLDAWQAGGVNPYGLVTVGPTNVAGLPELVVHLLDRRMAFRLSLVRDLQWGTALFDDRHGPERVPAARLEPPQADDRGLLAGPALRALQATLGRCYDAMEERIVRDSGTPQAQPRFRGSHKFCDLEPWRPIRRACGAGQTYLAISESGAVSPCQAALHHSGTQPLQASPLDAQAAGQQQFASFVRKQAHPVCARCPHRASCAGGCPLLLHRRDGHTDGRSPYCEVFKAVLPRIVAIAARELMLEDARERQTAAHFGF